MDGCNRCDVSQKLQPRSCVGSLSLDASERRTRFRGKRRECRIVLDLLERARSGRRHLHSRIQNPCRIEAAFHQCEPFAHLGRPHSLEERRAQAAIAVLAGECSAQLRDELSNVVENSRHSRAPIGDRHVDERIHVDVRVACVTEDHAANSIASETLANAAHVIGKTLWRHRTVLDELHGPERRIEARQDRTRCMAQLRGLIECEVHRRRARTLEEGSDGARRDGGVGRRFPLYLRQQHRFDIARHVKLATGSRDVEERAVEQLAGDGAALARANRGVDGIVERGERSKNAARRLRNRRQ